MEKLMKEGIERENKPRVSREDIEVQMLFRKFEEKSLDE